MHHDRRTPDIYELAAKKVKTLKEVRREKSREGHKRKKSKKVEQIIIK